MCASPVDPGSDRGEPSGEGPPSIADDRPVAGLSRLLGRSRTTASAAQQRVGRLLVEHRHRAAVDLVLRLRERDRDAAGTVVGSAIAFRLFLFFVPMLLFVVGLAGFLTNQIGDDDVADAGITGNLARQIDDALTQPSSTRWIATGVGFVGMLGAGRTLSKVMAAASCLSWRIPVRGKASVRAIGATVGLVVGLGLVSAVINKIHHELGVGMAGLSFVGALAIYLVAWVLLSLVLPRATTDPGALLPGAALVALTLTGLQALSQLYLPGRFSRTSELYGAVGVVIVTLGWFFIMGRVIVLSLTLDAVVYERFGSISTFVFDLPVLRSVARRSSRLRRFFGLDSVAVGAVDDPDVPP